MYKRQDEICRPVHLLLIIGSHGADGLRLLGGELAHCCGCLLYTSFDEWVALDLKYIQERSFWVDWKIIFLTVRAMLMKYGE